MDDEVIVQFVPHSGGVQGRWRWSIRMWFRRQLFSFNLLYTLKEKTVEVQLKRRRIKLKAEQ